QVTPNVQRKQHTDMLHPAQNDIVPTTQHSNTSLNCSLEHLPQGVVIIDAELRLVAWNTRYVELFRFPPELMQVGQPIEDLFRYNAHRGLLGHGPIEDAIQRRLNHLRSGKPHMRESEKQDGTVLEIRGNSLPEGGFVTSYTDITSYKNATRELRLLADTLEHCVTERTRDLDQARREAENANRYKTRFVASAVHDLLQPLNAARMFVAMLRKQLHETDALRITDNIDSALIAQDAILSSLLDISRLESGTLKTQVHHFALGPLLETLAGEFGILAQSRGLTLTWVPTCAIVCSDEILLRRILQNFLSNAIRYTPRGRVLIGCRRHGDWLRIEVHDQGPGIPESLQSEIFEEFRRLDDGVANDRGAGLGLAIVERIGRLLNHRIGLRSTLGHGSTFSVSVPLGEIEATHPILMRTPMPPRELEDEQILDGCA
ncbi:MAG TPA: sensor histidine kinase, partial [Xylella taiwanensis]